MRRSLPVVAVFSAVLLAACGGSGSTTASSPPAGGAGTGTASATTTSSSASQTTVTATATATATAGSTPSDGGTAVGSGPAACRAAGLALRLLGQQGATGHGELGFALRNTASASCSTVGYPGVQFLSRAGGDLPTTPTHTTQDFFGHTTLRPLVVEPGQSVSFRLGVTHGEGSAAGCTTAYALQVIAPNDTATLRLLLPDGAAECGQTTVSPLEPGDSAYP